MQQTQSICHEIASDSPVITKYYLQFADHFLIDLIKKALKEIVVFGASASELPIAEIQRQIYLIYQNTSVHENDVQDAVDEQFRKAARFHRKQLELVFAQLQNHKHVLSDMRSNDNSWVQNFNRYEILNEGSACKIYGPVGQTFWHIFSNLNSALAQATILLQHLIDESIIPTFSLAELKSRVFSTILFQLTLIANASGGPNITAILPTLSSRTKREFVYCSQVDVQRRIILCAYDTDLDLESFGYCDFDDKLFLQKRCEAEKEKKYMSDLVAKMAREHLIRSSPESRLNLCSSLPIIMNDPPSIFDRIGELCDGELSQQYLETLEEQHLKQNLGIFDLLKHSKQVQHIWRSQQDCSLPLTSQKPYLSQQNSSTQQNHPLEHRSSHSSKQTQGHQHNKETNLNSTSLAGDNPAIHYGEQENNLSKSKQQQQLEKQKESNLLEPLTVKLTEEMDQASSSLKGPPQQKQPFTTATATKDTKQEHKLVNVKKYPIDTSKLVGKMLKKTGKEVTKKDLQGLTFSKEMLGLSFKQEEERWGQRQQARGIPHQLKLEKEDIIKLTKEQLKKIEKVAKLGEMTCREDFALMSKEYKLLGEGLSHKIQIKKTVLTSDLDRKSHLSAEIIEKLTKISFMDDSDEEDLERAQKGLILTDLDQQDSNGIKEQQQLRKKKNRKNKKKKNKQQQPQQQLEKPKIKDSSIAGKKQFQPNNQTLKGFSEDKSEQEINLTAFLESWNVEEKPRLECHSAQAFLQKCKDKINQWKKTPKA